MHLDDLGLVPIGAGIHAGAAKRLGPVGREPLYMQRVEAVAERMGDDFVSHHPVMPSLGETSQTVDATRRFEDSLHASMMTIVPAICKRMGVCDVRRWNLSLTCSSNDDEY